MNRKTDRDLSLISFGALVAVFVVSAPLLVSAQGWRTGEPKAKARAQPSDANNSAGAPKKATNTHKTSRVSKARTNPGVASSGDPKTKPSAPKTTIPGVATAETKASRERLVDHNKNSQAMATRAPAPKKWEVKGERVSGGNTRAAEMAKARTGRCNPDQDERIDLSGTYNGDVNYPNRGLSGDATLTITGNRFTLRSGSRTESGSITAVTTCTYNAVAMMFGEWRTPKPGEPSAPLLPMLSLTATRKGDQLILKSSPSERREFSFAPAAKK